MYFLLRLLSLIYGPLFVSISIVVISLFRIRPPGYSPIPAESPAFPLDWIFDVPTKDSLQQNKAEEAALVRSIVEAIATSVLEQRIAYAANIRRCPICLSENVNGPNCPSRRNDTR